MKAQMAANTAAATAAAQAMQTVTIRNPNPTDDSDDEDSPSTSPVRPPPHAGPFRGVVQARVRCHCSWLSENFYDSSCTGAGVLHIMASADCEHTKRLRDGLTRTVPPRCARALPAPPGAARSRWSRQR